MLEVIIINDVLLEETEFFSLSLTLVTQRERVFVMPSQATVNILDNDG